MSLALLEWRRTVADLYADIRATTGPEGHALWVARRAELFATSTESPLQPGTSLDVAAYDPAWRAVVPLASTEPEHRILEGGVGMDRIGVLNTPWGPLDAWWLDEYSGGLFVPVKDATAGTTSYGAGRYLLDTAKGADLGSGPDGVVVDLNFLYNPSCAYDPRWSCPLAPSGNVLPIAVSVGERLPLPARS